MSEHETRRQAEGKLEDAIKEYIAAVHGEDEGILVDWLLITAEHYEDDKGSATANGLYGPTHQRIYNAAGLLDYAQVKVRSQFLRDR